MMHKRKVAIIGLGYVGLPIAAAFAAAGLPVFGFDIDSERISELKRGVDRNRETEQNGLSHPNLTLSSDAAGLSGSDFLIVTVPTPIDEARRPDLSAMISATKAVAKALKRGDIVVYESTVYPGAVEEECIPILESISGLKSEIDFGVGYSPERINPGDKIHRLENVVKVVSAQNEATLDIVAGVYGSVVTAGIHRAPSIKVAEAAKVIENTQRDLNIAFMNELSLIFGILGIDTGDVLAAAETKWNFLPFRPGLVGGHCIGVDPYYLTFRAEKAGYHPEVILAGRRINDEMGRNIAQECVRRLLRKMGRVGTVTILGMTFKENVPDIRNSRVVDMVNEFKSFGTEVQVLDPLADKAEALSDYGIVLADRNTIKPADAVVFAVAHDCYVSEGWSLVQGLLADGRGLVFDVKMKLERAATPSKIDLWRP